MSEQAPITNFKFGFSFPELENDELDIEEYQDGLIDDIDKAEVMAYAGRRFEEAAARYRSLAMAALLRVGNFQPEMSNDYSFVKQHAQYHTIKSQHYANLAKESATTVETVYENAEALYDLIQSSRTDGLVYDFDEVDDQEPEMDLQLELPLDSDEWMTEAPTEFPEQPFEEQPAAARHQS